jgi:hypothetical protein
VSCKPLVAKRDRGEQEFKESLWLVKHKRNRGRKQRGVKRNSKRQLVSRNENMKEKEPTISLSKKNQTRRSFLFDSSRRVNRSILVAQQRPGIPTENPRSLCTTLRVHDIGFTEEI